jgi:hypothetical protein
VKRFTIVLICALAALVMPSCQQAPGSSAVKLDSAYQAVLLDNGQVYYGKMQGLGTDYPVLTDVFYVQSAMNQQTKQVTNVLIRRGSEWHSPDKMYLNAHHIVLVEPVGQSSKVAQLIADAKK